MVASGAVLWDVCWKSRRSTTARQIFLFFFDFSFDLFPSLFSVFRFSFVPFDFSFICMPRLSYPVLRHAWHCLVYSAYCIPGTRYQVPGNNYRVVRISGVVLLPQNLYPSRIEESARTLVVLHVDGYILSEKFKITACVKPSLVPEAMRSRRCRLDGSPEVVAGRRLYGKRETSEVSSFLICDKQVDATYYSGRFR